MGLISHYEIYKIYKMFKFTIQLSILCCLPLSSTAEQVDLMEKGRWSVYIEISDDGIGKYCTAETVNSKSQVFDITFFRDGSLVFYLFDNSWQLDRRLVDFIVDFDYNRWEMTGTADGSMVRLAIEDEDTAMNFLHDVSSKSAVAIYNSNLEKISSFSLNGSAAAVLAVVGCAADIAEWQRPEGGRDIDPFQTQNDPF